MEENQKPKAQKLRGIVKEKKTKMNFETQSSSSSSSSSKKKRKRATDKTEDGQAEKKLKGNSKRETKKNVKVEDKSFIEKLPPEMLIQIIKYFNVENLLVSRLVNRRWNGVASKILQSRDNVEVVFQSYRPTAKSKEELKIALAKNRSLQLSTFVKRYKNPKNPPIYTRLSFRNVQLPLFDHSNWFSFILDFGKHVKRLKLETGRIDPNIMEWIEELRDLLLNGFPSLQEFGLKFGSNFDFLGRRLQASNMSKIQLFPKTKTKRTTAFQLPDLKVLYIDKCSYSDYRGIFTDILQAAVNLEKIEFVRDEDDLSSSYSVNSMQNFLFLQSIGKLDCIKTATIHLDSVFLSQFENNFNSSSSAPLKFNLKELNLFVYKTHENTSICIAGLLESIKNTLIELTMTPLGFLPDVRLPKFHKLTKLSIKGTKATIQVLPPGIKNLEEIFPLLQYLELGLPWTAFFPQDKRVTCIPNLKTLKITGTGGQMTAKDIARISKVCPNLKKLVVSGALLWTLNNFPEVGRAIWTHLKKLESLYLQINYDSKVNIFPALDSCITGFSPEYCTRLFQLIQAEQLSENPEFLGEIPQSELEAKRKNVSMMDLKSLRNLTVVLISKKWKIGDSPKSLWSKEKLIVSQKYSFKFMDNLNFKIVNLPYR